MYRVLLVDDDPHIQAANQAFLQRMGYQIFLAENGPDAPFHEKLRSLHRPAPLN